MTDDQSMLTGERAAFEKAFENALRHYEWTLGEHLNGNASREQVDVARAALSAQAAQPAALSAQAAQPAGLPPLTQDALIFYTIENIKGGPKAADVIRRACKFLDEAYRTAPQTAQPAEQVGATIAAPAQSVAPAGEWEPCEQCVSMVCQVKGRCMDGGKEHPGRLGWNPMESAPLDTDIWVYGLAKIWKGSDEFMWQGQSGWNKDDNSWWTNSYDDSGEPLRIRPLGWRALPGLPEVPSHG